MFIIKHSISTCFGYHYAHHQENKTVFYYMLCSAWVCRLWLAVVLWSCVVHDAAPQDQSQPQPTNPGRTQHVVEHGLILLMMGIMMPETCCDRMFDSKHRISCILLVLSFPFMFTMYGHKNLKQTVNVSLVTLTLLLTCYPVAETHESFRKCFHFYLNWVAANRTARIQSKSVPLFFVRAHA